MILLGSVAAFLAVAVLGLGAWLHYGGARTPRAVSVAIAPLKDEIEPLAPPPKLAAPASQIPPGLGLVPADGKAPAAGSGAGNGTPAPAAGPTPSSAAPTGHAPKPNPAATAAAAHPAQTPGAPGTPPLAPSTVPVPGQTSSSGTLILKPPPINDTGVGGEHALSPAPDPGLIERGKYGFEPVVGHDGRVSWQVYARPFPLNDPRPRIAIIVTSLGIGSTATDAAINKLPADVTLAFAPFSRRISEWTSLARLAGHEILLELPMEPVDYPRQDPGYNALLTANSTDQNLDRLDWDLSQTVGYVGLVGRMGGRFQAARDALAPIMQDIAQRGLLFVDNRTSAETTALSLAASNKLPYAATSRVVDAQPDGTLIVRNLADLEDIARRNHVAVGLISATPGAIDRISAWAAGLQARGIMLAPVSAVVAVPVPPPPVTPANADGGDSNAPAAAPNPAPADGTKPVAPPAKATP